MSIPVKSVPDSLCVTRWPTVSWRVLSFLGGFSFLGLYCLPTAVIAMLSPALGPLLLALAGLLAMRRGRGREEAETDSSEERDLS